MTKAFEVGERQCKLYFLATKGFYDYAKEQAEKIVGLEEEIQKYCNTDTLKAREIMEKIIKELKKKKIDVDNIERMLRKHDTEILDAIRKATC